MPADKTITELESISSSSLSLDDELPIYEKTNGSTLKTTIGDLKGLCLEDAVMKTGDTMTGELWITADAPTHKLSTKSSNITAGSKPSETEYSNDLMIKDSSNTIMANVYMFQFTSGQIGLSIGVRNRATPLDAVHTMNQFQLRQAMDGTNSVYISHPGAWWPALFPSNVATQTMNLTAATLGDLYHCTGTKYGGIYFQHLFGRFFVLSGRFFIANFVRSSSNPGVYITIPSAMPVPLTTYTEVYGFRGENANEQVQFQFTANSRSVLVTTTESFTNVANGRLTFMFPAAVCYLR